MALPALLLGRVVRVGRASPRALGAQLGRRDAWATAVAVGLGGLLAAVPLAPLLQKPGGVSEAHRLFALLLVASTAEVLVFLGAFGNAVRLGAGGIARWRSALPTLVASSLAFGFFHLTYPAPWNTIGVCLGLTVVWALVSLVFLLSQSLVAAIVLNNIMAMIGFAQNAVELPGAARVGWLEGALALVLFSLLFNLARRHRPVPQ